MQTKKELLAWLEENQQMFIEIADDHWNHPELALKEFRAAKLEAETLEKDGFKIRWNIGGQPTAFIAEWGHGRPIIGILGEYDALKNLSQKIKPTQEPIEAGGPGHGCGHNLLGVGGLAAGMAIKHWLQATGKEGTIRYYGCPAEEILAGKVYMAREGAFDDLDAALNYHPGNVNMVSKGSAVGLNNLKFRFHGRASHAGGSPHLGRSALDAVELMNVGANYLREHVESSTRIHYVITHGGDLPNIVPPEAEVWYFVRAPKRAQVDEVTDRIRKIAQGAAMMTETTFDEIFHTGCYQVLNNHVLADLQYENMKEIGPMKFNQEELDFAHKIDETIPLENRKSMFAESKLPSEYENADLLADNFPSNDIGEIQTGSTDVGDVSWITPLAMLNTTCTAVYAPAHNWAFTATCGMSIGHKGMMHAAKIMAATAIDLYNDPQHLKMARDEFEKATEGKKYQTPLPAHAQLPD